VANAVDVFIILLSAYCIYLLISHTFFTWDIACILPAAYTCNIPRGIKFSISNSLDRTEDDILWTDVRDDTHDTDKEDDTYNDLLYLQTNFLLRRRFFSF